MVKIVCKECKSVFTTKSLFYKHKNEEHKIFTYVDLFCGLGAFHTAFNRVSNKKNKYQCVFACDINKDVRNIYHENYDLMPEGDINELSIEDIPDFDILCAGFPCQPFSIAGKKEGFDDIDKGNLFFKILEIIDIKNPSIVFLENVKNLHTMTDTFKIIKDELEKREYIFSYKVIDSKYYNCPQSRKRIYIICQKKEKYEFKEIDYPIVPVSSIIDHEEDNYFDYSSKYYLEQCTGGIMKYKLINKITKKGGRQGERIYGIDSYGPTICASSGGPGSKTGLYLIDGNVRTLNIKEAFLMFGFNDDYKYSSLKNKKKMLFYLGNSIVVNVLEELITNLSPTR